MESGLEDRNNYPAPHTVPGAGGDVSMESGLEDRNNSMSTAHAAVTGVSMESGLEDRNNEAQNGRICIQGYCLNGVRPRRPEQCTTHSRFSSLRDMSQWSPA